MGYVFPGICVPPRGVPYEKIGEVRRLAMSINLGFLSYLGYSWRDDTTFSCQSIFKGELEEMMIKNYFLLFSILSVISADLWTEPGPLVRLFSWTGRLSRFNWYLLGVKWSSSSPPPSWIGLLWGFNSNYPTNIRCEPCDYSISRRGGKQNLPDFWSQVRWLCQYSLEPR